jgi:hypothetical protein
VPPRGFESLEQVSDVLRLRAGVGVERDAGHDRADLLQRLEVGPVVEPRLARPDPPDRVGVDAVVEQPDARVHRRLARPEDGEGRHRDRRELVHRHDARVLGGLEARHVRRRHGRLQVPRIDNLPADHELILHVLAPP